MKRNFTILLALPLFFLFHLKLSAQTNTKLNSFYLGKSENLLKGVNASAANARSSGPVLVDLRISSSKSFKGKVNLNTSTSVGQSIAGSLQNISRSSFFITVEDKVVKGNIILLDTKKAYEYASDAVGNAYVTEVDINKVLCIDYLKNAPTTSETQNRSSGSVAQIGAAVSNLQSYPQGIACVYLDFDGHFYQGAWWASGAPINALPSPLNDDQVLEAWELTSEDFSPFNINVTTSETVFNSYPTNKRQRCVITPTTDANPGSGGVAYVDMFRGDVPCWVFTHGAKNVGEAISHEIGHTLGLSHDGRTSPVEEYYAGQGNYAPIMGVGYYKSIAQWSKGEYANANNKENDFSIIIRPTRATGVKPDEHGNTTATATPLQIDASGNVSASLNFGIIGTTSDVDMFSFSTAGGNAVLNFNPAARHGDLDILVTLYNSSGGVVTTSDPVGLAAVINTTLAPGNYFISIDGTGADDPITNGYSDYGSLGFFSISGMVVPVPPTNQLPVVNITAPISGTLFTAPATVLITANASDPDGSIYKVEFFYGTTKIGEDLSLPFSFSWTSVPIGSYSITAKATDNQGSQVISAPVSIQVNANLAPVVSITSPQLNALFSAPATVDITANASDTDGSVTKVEFFYGVTKIGEDLTQPFTFSWTGVPVGSYSITAKATDNQGSQTISTPVVIQVKANVAPTISIITPQQNAVLLASSTIVISTTASDADGSISKVEFFNGALKLGESLTSPYTFSWTNVPYGNYTIVAKATDNLGATTSSQVNIVVDQLPVANAGKDQTLVLPLNSLSLVGSGSAKDGLTVTFTWTQLSGPNAALFSSTSTSLPDVSNLIAGVYVFELTVTNSKGLTSKDDVMITVELPLGVAMGDIPRFFSPNGDGNNDLWEWSNVERYLNSKLTVFNQSGQQIYLAESYNNTWDGKVDGKPLSDNAYYYVIQLSNNMKITGAVRIIR